VNKGTWSPANYRRLFWCTRKSNVISCTACKPRYLQSKRCTIDFKEGARSAFNSQRSALGTVRIALVAIVSIDAVVDEFCRIPVLDMEERHE
jgi:hypothetical protein